MHGWRLMQESESLVCGVLKARYFPNCWFLDARLGRTPSYTWSSIHASQGLVLHGTRWKIGSGSTVSVWGSRWLSGDGSIYAGPNDMYTRVEGDERDKQIWHHERRGIYTVKSSYKLAATICRDESLEETGNWGAIWKLTLPPKVKDFIWRLCRNVLPNKMNLFPKKIVDEKSCVRCGYFEETNWHTFVDSPFAKNCWDRSELRGDIEGHVWNVDGCSELVFRMIESPDESKAESFCMLAWQIWKERNNMVWTGNGRSEVEAVCASAAHLAEWVQANQTRAAGVCAQPDRRKPCRAWHAPPIGAWKINVDAAFFEDMNQTGIGMVVRDDLGMFVTAKVIKIQGCIGVDVGEAMGFYEALKWVHSLGLENVVVEGDSKIVVDAICSETTGTSVFFDFVRECKRLLQQYSDFSVAFVRRDANILAHEFARASRDFESSFCWVDTPNFVVGLPDTPCICNNEH